MRMTNESFAERLGVAVRSVANWEAKPDMVPAPAAQEILDAVLQMATADVQRRFALLQANPGPARLELPSGSSHEVDFMASAHESAMDAALHSGRVSDALGPMQSDVTSIARRYPHRGPVIAFAEARRLRNLACQMAERTRRPRELADIYMVAGASSALMASIAFDLGQWDAARSLAQSATQYADIAGHTSLESWTWGLQATLANWRGDLPAALDAFDRGMLIAPAGAPRRRLRYIAARTRSALGDPGGVMELLRDGQLDREAADAVRDEMEHVVGGEFAFDDARATACAAAAWLEVKDGERAESDARAALQLYESLAEADRPFSPVNGLQIDISAARALRADIDGAHEALAPVLQLEPSKRNAALTGRMEAVRKHLNAPKWRNASDAPSLATEIAVWSAQGTAGLSAS
jgi:hypothetical protein